MQTLLSPGVDETWRLCTSLADSGRVPLVLARHGRTRMNAERRFVGRLDAPLDEVGLEEAQRLGLRLRDWPLAGLYSSPLQRARQTAAPMGQPILVPELQELYQGELEGLSGPEAFARFPEVFTAWAQDPASARLPGGESLEACQQRALSALTGLATRHRPGPPVLVVTHQMVLATTILACLGMSLRHLKLIRQANTTLNTFSWREDEGLRVHRLNDRAHLPD